MALRNSSVPVLTTAPQESSRLSTAEFKESDSQTLGFDEIILRSLKADDLPAYHTLLQEKETMILAGLDAMYPESTAIGYFNQVIEEPWRVGIFLQPNNLIGDAGVSKNREDWPEVFIMLKQEYRAKGYATQAILKLLTMWWNLSRETTELNVQPISLDPDETSQSHQGNLTVRERLYFPARINSENVQRKLKKYGLEFRGEVQKKIDSNEGETARTYYLWQIRRPQEN
ncbi:hypothetical protein BS50DRAFT_586935 [Corynespora cassiicola Philippines]|uniref:N-acetyltransferase domain-containing protein n=1 Tax=Corynespora cassiicola Philippines TaxID=1448308 RepID=A0A2T2NQF9_CORCC|nr:hypothetical protein BS50DRAFT_586935 [Corynespora cassiicola Philippines]